MNLKAVLENRRTVPVILTAIMALAVVLRLCGIMYGLPFRLVGDEPSQVLGSLYMLQQKVPL